MPPILVDPATAPCRQNVLLGDEASLDRFPIPIAHENDGGRYANTWGTLIVKTPDGSWVNWSISRVMKIDGKRMTGLIIPPQHIGLVWEQWVARGEPLKLVKALTVDLEVPHTAEIVIEGHVSLERDSREGPFGEYAGYLATDTSMQPTYHVEAIISTEEYARRVGETLFPTKPMAIVPKIFLLDDDIDPTDLPELTWAIATRVHPIRRRAVFEGQLVAPVVMSYSEHEYAAGGGPKVVFDCLPPPVGGGRLLHSSFAQAHPAELRKRVIENWQ